MLTYKVKCFSLSFIVLSALFVVFNLDLFVFVFWNNEVN
jgi:hypothetical protein